jgi:hypothetical protein
MNLEHCHAPPHTLRSIDESHALLSLYPAY